MQKQSQRAVMVIGLLAFSAPLASAETGPAGPEGRGAMVLEMFDKADTDKDGKLTEAEMAAFRQTEFVAADTNADGLLSPEELTAQQLARMTAKVAERTTRMIAKQDANADGSLSATEIPVGDATERFARLDTDDDGAVSKDEARAGMEKFAERRKKRHSGGMDDGGN